MGCQLEAGGLKEGSQAARVAGALTLGQGPRCQWRAEGTFGAAWSQESGDSREGQALVDLREVGAGGALADCGGGTKSL